MRTCLTAGWALCALMAAGVSSAHAGISKIIYELEATNALGSVTFQVPLVQGSLDANGVLTWNLPTGMKLVDERGQQIALLNSASTVVRSQLVGNFGYQIDFRFNVTAGLIPGSDPDDPGTETTFVIKSALLDFPTLLDANGRATMNATLFSQLGDEGATLAGYSDEPNGAPPIYKALINGADHGGGNPWASLLTLLSVDAPGAVLSASQAQPPVGLFQAIGEPISAMSGRMSFTLTQGDRATGTGFFQVVPEPVSVVLLAAGMLPLVVRRLRVSH